MSYPDVVIACIEHHDCLWKHSEQLRQRWWSTIIIWRIIPWWWLITITANHSNYLVCDRANTQSVTVSSGKNCNSITALVIKWIYNIVLIPEGRTRDVHSSSLLIDVYALFSDVDLTTAGFNDPGWEIPGPFLLKSDEAISFKSFWLGKRMLRVVVLRVLFFVDMRLPRIQCRWFVLSEVVFTLSWCRSINTIPAS